MLNDVTKDKRSQSDGGDGVQEHGGGLDHAADGAGLIHQILDSPAVLRVAIEPLRETLLLRFYAELPTAVVSAAYRLETFSLHCIGFCGSPLAILIVVMRPCVQNKMAFAEGQRTCTHE